KLDSKEIETTKESITQEGYSSCSTKILPVESVLFTSRASIGKIAITKNEMCTNQGFKSFVCGEKILPNFLYYCLRYYTPQLERLGSGSTFKEISMTSISKFKIPVPPLEAQKKIVSILERADALRQKRKKANEDTKKLVQSIFFEMFGNPITNEKDYEIKNLSEISVKITDGTHKTPLYVNRGVPFLRVTDLTKSNLSKKFITKEEHELLIKRCKPEKNDILYTKNGTIGIAKVVDWDYEFSVFVSLCLIKPNLKIIRPIFLETFLNTPFALHQAKSNSKKGTITNLHLIDIRRMKIPLPSLSEQDFLIKRIMKIKFIEEKQLQSIKDMNKLFKALLQKAFTGELM
ncbi:restriction endonuclease subunit S, partial [archaeon]|nr:restriction endonuclease subunit S [archaeon]